MGDKRLIVYLLYESEYGHGFRLLCKYHHHLYRFVRIAAGTVQNGTTTAYIRYNPFTYFVVFGRKDEKLNRLAVPVQHHVEYIVAHQHFDKGKNNLINTVKQEIRRTNNKEIAEKLFLSEGTVRNYISVILEKLDLRDRTQLAIFYYKNKE